MIPIIKTVIIHLMITGSASHSPLLFLASSQVPRSISCGVRELQRAQIKVHNSTLEHHAPLNDHFHVELVLIELCSEASPMIDRPRASSLTGTLQRAAIACQSCRQRKVKVSRPYTL